MSTPYLAPSYFAPTYWPPDYEGGSGSGPPLVPMDASFRAAFSDGITISPEEPIMPNPFGEGITVRGNP